MGQKKRSAQNPTAWPDLTQTDQLQTPDLLIRVDTNRQITLREHATYLRLHTCLGQQAAAQRCVLTPFPYPYPRVSPMVKRLYHASFTHCQQFLYGKKLRIAWIQVGVSPVRKRMASPFRTPLKHPARRRRGRITPLLGPARNAGVSRCGHCGAPASGPRCQS